MCCAADRSVVKNNVYSTCLEKQKLSLKTGSRTTCEAELGQLFAVGIRRSNADLGRIVFLYGNSA